MQSRRAFLSNEKQRSRSGGGAPCRRTGIAISGSEEPMTTGRTRVVGSADVAMLRR